MNYPMNQKVWVSGDKTRMYWTLRALARAGYMVVEDADVHISITENGWSLQNLNFDKIEDLLQKLTELK